MRILLILLVFPGFSFAGDFSLTADAWAQDRERGFGLEYSVGEEWRPSVLVSHYENDFQESSWYGGIGLSKSLRKFNDWNLLVSARLLYFDHGSSTEFYPATGEPYEQDGNIIVPADMTLIREYERSEYVAVSPSVSLSYQSFGVVLTALQLPDREWSTALQFRISL